MLLLEHILCGAEKLEISQINRNTLESFEVSAAE
jgi:hypothetical protein